MKTEISRFCEAALNILNPLPPAIATAADKLEQGSDPALLRAPLASLNEVRARLRSLADKLSHQQAYLLIFGPLKSGKSTLMNAISGAYVSEVTSLPGYPCLVYVAHSDEPHFSVTRYNGRESVFANGRVLKDVIADSHLALAEQIRATEARGTDFDPRTHFTEAIRRIDVKVPVASLAESSTVLVDTPGLYSRMNFGYDVLTREFRDSAACAVFVVKTDNLFLEQVFAEFNQLLDLFSRIFLVINVDSSKRDLRPDGSLEPSAESQHPEQIIEAFKTLSMAGPLRAAYESKRVRIHAVDLMNAASHLLTSSANGNGNGNGSAPEPANDSFATFMRDLTDYLNSSDYTLEFIRDSLRQGRTLCREIGEITESSELARLREMQGDLDIQMRDIDERLAAVDRLLKVDWAGSFQKVGEENASSGSALITARAAQLKKDLGQALESWSASSDSLKALQDQHWNPRLVESGRSLSEETRARLQGLLGTPLGGAEPAALVMNDLHTVGFSLAPIAQAALPKLSAAETAEPYRMSINPEEVPVRKSFVDWLLFRKVATVRRLIFGEDLAQEIPPEVKQKRLSDSSREALSRIAEEAVNARFPSLPAKFSEMLLAGYVAAFRSRVLDGLRALREELLQQRTERQAPFEANSHVLQTLEALQTESTKVDAQLQKLAEEEDAKLHFSNGGQAPTLQQSEPTVQAEPISEPAAV